MESFNCIDGDVVDAVLECLVLEVGLQVFHEMAVFSGNFGRVELEGAVGFEVDEACGASVVVELQFVGAVECMEEYYFVFVMAQVAQGVDEVFLLVVGKECVCEDDDEGAPVELFGGEVERFWKIGGRWFEVGMLRGLEEVVEECEQVALVGGVGAARGL